MGSADLIHSLLPVLAILGAVLVVKELLDGFGAATLHVRPMPLMTPTERRTYSYIEDALPWARVHAQVSMGAIMAPKAGLNRSKATTVRNRFSSKRIDYVVEDRASGAIVMLIELDDRSHRAEQDARRDRMTGAAGYFTLRLPASEKPTAHSVRRHLAAVFDQQPQLQAGGGRVRHY